MKSMCFKQAFSWGMGSLMVLFQGFLPSERPHRDFSQVFFHDEHGELDWKSRVEVSRVEVFRRLSWLRYSEDYQGLGIQG